MQLSKFTDYAFRVLMYIVHHQDALHTIPQLAEQLHVSQNHLVKVVHFMAKQHWLITTRGKGGGIRVSSLVLSMPVGEVIRTLQGDPKLVDCNTPVCILKADCHLKNLLDEALEQFYQTLNQYTISQCIGAKHAISLISVKNG
ncbi:MULTISPECIES: Rrf2 family transcriptional regulator [Glaesserella]|uniref:Transcriptional regulator n=1 Tax=Glaesserella australis TaxID=2094024 RepID=A0A328BYN6_9PAST|nr:MULTISPECIES: Rrf2 family transcriptional regulator [Glaesserella]AUI66318.1 transcriptional regulator [Glaesserella sp. 15-184]RAL19468.1 transcriptional regulator [Glaesserella australis]